MAEITIQQAFDLAVQHHQAGEHGLAEELYGKIIEVVPQHPHALHHLGILASQMGRNDLAVDYIEKALAIAPQMSAAHSNLGCALNGLGRFDAAVAACSKALELQPDLPDAWNNIGNALFELGRLDEAEAALRRALLQRPGFPQAKLKLLDVLVRQRRDDEALALVNELLVEQAGDPSVFNALGTVRLAQGKLDEALAVFDEALARQSGGGQPPAMRATILNNRGHVLKQLGRSAEAAATFHEALALTPNDAAVQNNLGLMLAAQGDVDGAITHLREALRLEPGAPLIHNNLANLLKDVRLHAEASVMYREGVEVGPAVPELFSNCLMASHYRADLDPREQFAQHVEWGRRHAKPLRETIRPHDQHRDPERRLRIGYLSADLRDHPVGRLLLPVFQNHDPTQVEWIGYSNRLREDDFTHQLRKRSKEWRDISPLNDTQIAELVRSDKIDILVELAGHTEGNRLLVFARKPAPVQVSFLGYPDTTGVDAIDYRFTDSLADPPGMTERFWTEELVRLDPCAWCFSPLPEIAPLARGNRPLTFGTFNVTAKVTDEMLRVWARILREVPGSHLLLKNFGWKSKIAQQRVHAIMDAEGVAAERIEMRGQHPTRDEHLAYHGHLDIALDTFPYHGTNMTFEALWMGTPVITLAGESHVSRVGVSMLTNAGHPEWVAANEEEYIAKAIAMAGQPELRARWRAGLRSELLASPLMDGAGMARRIEAAYRTMWHRWCAGGDVESLES